MDDSPLLAAALRYAGAGVYVFPTRLHIRGDGRKGVSPIADWDTASSTDPAVLRSWWGAGGTWEGAALCIDCGRSGIVGVDQDVHDGKDGISAWAQLAGAVASPWRVRTPTGGLHDYFKSDSDHLFTIDNTGAVADGVDIRGLGGFLFAPPTIDPRGGAWAWEGEGVLESVADLPTVPEVVIEAMARREASKRRKAPSATVANGLGAGKTTVATVRALPTVADRWSGQSAAGAEGGGLGQLFESEDPGWGERDFGPEGGWKTREDATELLARETAAFAALTREGSSRSHILSQRLGVLAGHGVPTFWSYEQALGILTDAFESNGFADVNGHAYATDQARRGLDYGMREPWHEIPAGALATVNVGERGQPSGSVGERRGVPSPPSLESMLLTPAQLRARPRPKHLIKGVLRQNSATWLIGAPGSYKSFVALDWAAHVATGREWRGKRVEQGEVIYVLAEGVAGFQDRVTAWETSAGMALDGLLVLPVAVQARGPGGVGVSDRWRELVALVAARAPRMVVLDTQARLSVGMEENSNSEMSVWVSAVDMLKEAADCCVLVVHHTGRNGADARGASAIDGAQDMEWRVDKDKDRCFTLSCDKNKDGPEDMRWSFAMNVVDVGYDEDNEKLTSLVLGREVPRDGQGGAVEQIELTVAEGRSLDCYGVVHRVLSMLDPDRMGMTLAEVVRAVNAARRRAGQTPFTESAVRSALNEGKKREATDNPGRRWQLTEPPEDRLENADE